MLSGAGAVRVRPAGLTASPSMKRYQYQRPGSRPVTSTCTLCASSGAASAVPLAAMLRKASSCATSQRTEKASGGMAAALNGSYRMRVHSTTAVGSGEPEATPRERDSRRHWFRRRIAQHRRCGRAAGRVRLRCAPA